MPSKPKMTGEQIAAMDAPTRHGLAQQEREALTAATVAGKPRPATPVLDWMTVNPEQVRTRKVGTARGVLPPEPAAFAYWIGATGSPVADRLVAVTQHSLSYMAGYTRTTDAPRVPSSDLLTMLREQGITDHENEAWTLTLPQCGRIVAHRPIPGRTPTVGPFAGVTFAESDTPNVGKVPDAKAPRKPRTPRKSAAPAGSRPSKRAAAAAAKERAAAQGASAPMQAAAAAKAKESAA